MALDLQARSMAAQVQANLDEYIETFQNGMKFVGVSSTDPLVSGATVSGYSDWTAGNIVLYSDKEYLLTATPNIAANWVKFGDDSGGGGPFAAGTGHDSAVLIATPNPEDPSVDRTNTVTGAFSAVLAGSRNNISATESAAAGGIITISGGGNNFGTGYRQTMTDCENSASNGYRNTLDSCAQVKALGRSLNLTYCSNGIFAGYDITCTGTGAEKCEGNALFGRDVSSTASYGLSAGLHIHISNSCAAAIGDNLLTSKYGQTNVGMWNKANNQAYFVVGSGQSEAARKNCFAAGWDGNGTTEDERKVIWIGDTKVSEKQIKQLINGANATLAGNNRFTGQNTFTDTTICYSNLLQDGNGNAYVTTEDITEVVANPEVYGSEDTLTSLQVGDTKYIVPSGGGGSDSSLKLAIDLWSNGGWSTSKDVTGTVRLFTNLLSTSGYSDEGVYAVLLGPPPEELDKLFSSEDQTEWESYFESLSDDHQCGFGYFNGEIMIDSRFIQSFFANAWDAFTPMALILKVDDFDENNPAVDWFNNRSYVHIIDLTWADITDALDNGN